MESNIKLLKIGSLFTGIGAWEKALVNLGINFDLKFFCELDKYAIKSYCAIHNEDEDKNLGDITKIDETAAKKLPDIDMLVYSPPCQAFSNAGKQEGFKDPRGVLFFDALRIIKAKMPKIALMENVKGLTQKKFKAEFEIMRKELEKLGYKNHYQILNTKDYGVPQNRERVFLISTLEDIEFEFPKPFYNGLVLRDFLEDEVDEKYYLADEKVEKLIEQISNKHQEISYTIDANYYKGTTPEQFLKKSRRQLVAIPCLTPDRINKRQNGRRFKTDGEPMFTLTGQDRHGILQVDIPQVVRVRKYEVDIEGLKKCLKAHKIYTNKEISEKLNVKLTTVEHWFRNDNCFSIPTSEIWLELKELLKIQTCEFDKSIVEFEEKEGVFEKSNRFYSDEGISPTLTTGNEPKILQPKRLGNVYNEKFGTGYAGNVWDKEKISPTITTMQGGGRQPMILEECRIRKLTPKECFRLQGFSDGDFQKCVDAGLSNTQLYKQAGNSITVDVCMAIFLVLFNTKKIKKEVN